MDRMSSKEKIIRTVLYWGLPVLAVALVIVGWVAFSAGHPDLMPAPLGRVGPVYPDVHQTYCKDDLDRPRLGQSPPGADRSPVNLLGVRYRLRYPHRMEPVGESVLSAAYLR